METGECLFNGKIFSAGEQVCDDGQCYVCRDGSWDLRSIDRVLGVGP